MTVTAGERFDFFLSRRGSVADVAREVTDVLTDKGYRVFVQDYDIPLGASFVEAMHEGIKASRDLIVLFTSDYEQSRYTRKEFTSFEAERARSPEERHIVVLRCQDVPLRGLLADTVYQDLVGVTDTEERKRRIIAAAEGQAQARRPPPRPFVGVPPRVANFTGREDALDRLDAILMCDKPAAVTQALGRVAVQGLGGVGKTSLAVEYAHRFRDLYAGVWWCPAKSRAGLLSSLAALAVTLGAASADEPDIEKAARVGLRRLAEQRATWLLVYDNVTSPEEISEFLPSAGARVLITSRFSDWSGWAEEVSLDVLPVSETVSFLLSRAGSRDEAAARILAEALGCLPLALDHAAATCRRMQLGFADYAVRASKLIASVPRGVTYPQSVSATFDLAINEAVAQCAAAEDLMAFLAQCAPERIPMVLIEGVIEDEVERLGAVAALTEVSLVKHAPFEDGSAAVTVHRLVQAVARVRAEGNGTAQQATERLIVRLAAVYPFDCLSNPNCWPLCAQLMPHVLALQEEKPSEASQGEPWPELLERAGSYFHGRGSYVQAGPLLRDALASYEKVLGPEHPNTALSLNSLALLLHSQGDYASARALLERALAINEKALGAEHLNTATSLDNLARLLREQGDFAGARPLHERALAIREKVLDPEHCDTAQSFNNLALLLQEQGDFVGARSLRERILAIREKAFGPEHPNTARSLNNLALLLQEQGDLSGARPLLERALAIYEKALGPEHPDMAISLSNLVALLRDEGDLIGARPFSERALATCEKALGPEHPNTNRMRCVLARILLASGEPAEALRIGETALAAHEKAFGPKDPWTLHSADVTAQALDALGRAAEASALRARYSIDADSQKAG